MDKLKRKILLEDYIDRRDNSDTYGELTATTFSISIFLSQTIDNMGMFTDIEFVNEPVDYALLKNKLVQSGFTSPFMFGIIPMEMTGITETDILTTRFTGKTENDYFAYDNTPLTGFTDSKLEDVKSYDATDSYKIGLDISQEDYLNYLGDFIDGHSRVVDNSGPIKYVFDTTIDINTGTDSQIYGSFYQDYSGLTRNVTSNGITTQIPLTTFRYIGEGLNETNTSLSAITKQEYLFGIVSPPEVSNDIFIERGVTSVLEPHLRMSEIKNLGELTRYGNGLFKLVRN